MESNPPTTTIDQIKAAFDEMVRQKRAAGLSIRQAEGKAGQQLVRDANEGQFDKSLVRDFILALIVSHGTTVEAARLRLDAIFSGNGVI